MLDESDSPDSPESEGIDPDPFSIGFTVLSILFAGGAYLEVRRTREFMETHAQNDFRTAWFQCKRTLIHARRIVEEFATYVSEDAFGTKDFVFGKVRLLVDTGRARQLRRLNGNAHTTAGHMGDDLDTLANFLNADYQPQIDEIYNLLKEMTQLPDRYRDVVSVARRALDLYEALVDAVEDREHFEETTANA